VSHPISPETVVGALHAQFGIQVAELVFLPIGDDSDSWAYRVETSGGPTYFLKVRAGAGNVKGAAVPDYLHRHGVPHVLAPVPANGETPWVHVDRFALTLYPMIQGSTGAEVGLSPEQWRELGAFLKQVHSVPLTPDLTQLVGREAFRPSRREILADLEPLITISASEDPVARELASVWRARQGIIRVLVGHADAMGRQLARLSFPRVLCHADLHTWNVLVDAGQQPWIVGWDEAIVAPKERDLMFVVGRYRSWSRQATRHRMLLPRLRRGNDRSTPARVLPCCLGGPGHRRAR
jgi:spectinomycin phosphotransferase